MEKHLVIARLYGEHVQTREHILLECPIFEDGRHLQVTARRLGWSFYKVNSLKVILGLSPILTALPWTRNVCVYPAIVAFPVLVRVRRVCRMSCFV